MQKVAAKINTVDGRVHGVNPAGGDKERLARAHPQSLAIVDELAEKLVVLVAARRPLLKELKVLLCRRNEPENLLALVHVIPDRCSAEIHVKIGIGRGGGDKTVLLHLGPRKLRLAVRHEAAADRPTLSHVIDLVDDRRPTHVS